MTPTIQDQIAALANTISHTEAELEILIESVKQLKWEAEQQITAASDLYEQCESKDDAAAKALMRRAENAKDLAAKMHAMTLRF